MLFLYALMSITSARCWRANPSKIRNDSSTLKKRPTRLPAV